MDTSSLKMQKLKTHIGYNEVDIDTVAQDILDLSYPVGSIYVTGSNTNPSDSSLLGFGTWTLFDKHFTSWSGTQSGLTGGLCTFNSTNIASASVFAQREGHEVRVRVTCKPAVTFADTQLEIGTFDAYDCFGCSSSDIYYGMFITAFCDGGNAVWMLNLTASAVLNMIDVVVKGSSSSMTTLDTGWVDFIKTMPYDRMSDLVCDKFFWKRTA